MKTRTLLVCLTVTAVLCVTLTACRNHDAEATTDPGPLKIATILGLTGQNSAYAVKMKNGLELARDEINDKGGVKGREVDLVIEDSRWDPKLGISAYRKLHDVDGVRLYSAICGSTVALAVCEASRVDDVVIVDAISTAPKLTTAGGPHFFRVAASDAMAGQNNVQWAADDEKARSFAVVYVEDDWGSSYKDAVVAELTKRGLKPLTVPVMPKARDLRDQAQRVVAAKPDAVFVVLYADLAVPFVQQARSLGLDAKLYGGDNLSSSDFTVAGPSATDGVRLSLPAEPHSQKYQAFADAYKAKFNEDPDVFALKSYDALMLLAHAISECGDDPAGIVAYLHGEHSFEGASGPLAFDANGDLVKQSYQRKVYQNGTLTDWAAPSE